MWTIYRHINKINGRSYIGKAKDVNNRWANNGSKYKTCPRFWSAIVHYGWDNFEHTILEDNIDDKEVDEREKFYIKYYNSLYPNGYNLAMGGSGGNAWAGKTQEEKQKFSEERRNETLSRGEDWHKKLSQAQYNRWSKVEEKEKMSNRVSGGKNPMAKKCFCVETGIIYNSYADAAEECGYPRSSGSKIGMVIRGQKKTFAGFHWRQID